MRRKIIYLLVSSLLLIILLSNMSYVKANDENETFSINKTLIYIDEGETNSFTISTNEELNFNISLSDENIISIIYNNDTITSSDNVTVNGTEEFTINTLNSGETTITIATETEEKTIKITVVALPVTTFDIDQQEITITKGNTASFIITCDGQTDFGIDTLDEDIISISYNDTTFTNNTININNNGTFMINAIDVGEATITVGIEYNKLSSEEGEFIEYAIEKEISVTVVENYEDVNNTSDNNNVSTISSDSTTSNSSLPYTGGKINFLVICLFLLVILTFMVFIKIKNI